MACKPRLMVESEDPECEASQEIDIELFRQIKEVLLCPVCFDVYKLPVNVRSCLHKYCANCIDLYNRKIKKECPGCRLQIGSRRVLRNDFKIQSISKHPSVINALP